MDAENPTIYGLETQVIQSADIHWILSKETLFYIWVILYMMYIDDK